MRSSKPLGSLTSVQMHAIALSKTMNSASLHKIVFRLTKISRELLKDDACLWQHVENGFARFCCDHFVVEEESCFCHADCKAHFFRQVLSMLCYKLKGKKKGKNPSSKLAAKL
jgi:hypothetical protein